MRRGGGRNEQCVPHAVVADREHDLKRWHALIRVEACGHLPHYNAKAVHIRLEEKKRTTMKNEATQSRHDTHLFSVTLTAQHFWSRPARRAARGHGIERRRILSQTHIIIINIIIIIIIIIVIVSIINQQHDTDLTSIIRLKPKSHTLTFQPSSTSRL